MSNFSPRSVDATYHPKGQGPSPSLQRARKPFRFGNAIIGSAIALFTAGVYTYSISSVKQDDFSDVEDLLPPLAERSGLRSIEDEARAAAANKKTSAFQSVVSTLPSRPNSTPGSSSVPVTGSFGAPQKALPSAVGVADGELGIGSSGSGLDRAAGAVERAGNTVASRVEEGVDEVRSTGLGGLPWPRRLDEVRWVRERGLVELGKGNVIVWGAPNVDNLGRVGEGGIKRNRGGRLV